VQLTAEMHARSLAEPGEDRPEEAFEDRKVTAGTTFDGTRRDLG